VAPIVLGGVGLLHQDVSLLAKPPARPGLVRPAEAETERRMAGFQDLGERTLDQPAAVEPVVVVTKPLDSSGTRQVGLGLACLGQAQVIEAQIGRNVGLTVPLEQGPGPGHVGPLGESPPPPSVVLRDRMKLRKVHREKSGWRREGRLRRRKGVHVVRSLAREVAVRCQESRRHLRTAESGNSKNRACTTATRGGE
jgi:hypothetical protein